MKAVREIDLANRPASRLLWLARLVVRSLQIAFWLGIAALRLPALRLTKGSSAAALGTAVTFLFTRLGATFIKVGQIMSSRPDVFPEKFLEPFAALQDRVSPFPFAEVRRILEEDFGRPLEQIFVEFREKPVASASIAQVHRAVLQDAELPPTFPSKVVAVKVRRPGIVRRAYLDEAILRFGARLLSFVPSLSLVSPVAAVGEFCEAVNKQLDFRIEAENNRRFRKNFADDSYFVIPALVDSLSSDRVLAMEFIDGVKEDQVRGLGVDLAFVARKGVEGVARMIFHHGFIHADLHPGNVLFLPGNRFGILDLGLVGVLSDENRRRYALLLYYTASGMGAEVARWFYEEYDSSRVADYPSFERDIAAVVATIHDRPIEDTQVTAALARIYDILRRHRIVVEATFTIANIAMMVVEGIARRLNPKLNVSREVRPYLEAALALSPTVAKEAPAAIDPTVPTQIAGGRYRVRRMLGEGVRKRVYLARDTRLDRDVALALLRTEGLDEAGRARITLEARAVARLADHPRIVPVYDTGEENGVPFVVSQYMGGGTLSGRLLRLSEHRFPVDVAIRFADQICQALEYAHGHGVVHRDVKPENIWLTEDGFAKLGDFGLARTLGRPEGSLDGMTVGTALYMPPEQALGRGVDHRSDLYSLGATLYELLTGRPPFEGETVAEVIASHIHATPEPPSRRNPLVPPGLDVIVAKLLAKRPDDRFDGAAAVREALRDLPAAAVVAEVPATPPQEPTAVFVGREQEMQRLRKAFEEAVAGRGRFVVLVGEPGIGKTSAAQLIAGYAARRGALVLTGRSFEGEGAPAFWPWVQILRAYLEGRDGARLESELGPGAVYAAHVVPEIREVLPELPALETIETEEARFKLFDAVVSFLRRASMTQPLFLFLDDLHWADKPSLLLLQFLIRELAGARIFVIGSYRDVDVQHGHPLADLLPSFRRERAFERILLRGLPEDDVRALVTAIAGTGVPEAFVRTIHRETEGNPFFIEETLRHLVEEGLISREDGRWTSRVSPEEMGMPEGVREVIGRRLSRLGDECRRLLTIAAVLGREFDPLALEAVAGVDAESLHDRLDEALAAQIVERTRDERRRFTHALIRETLYAELGAAERVRLHQRIAAALERLYVADPEPHLSELAYHFFEATPAGGVDRAVHYATLAGERADRQLAYEEAAVFYERAVRALESMTGFDEREQCDLLVRLGAAQWRSAEYVKARTTLLRAAELAERCGRPEALARAALFYTGEESVAMIASVGNPTLAPLLERALQALPAEDSGERAQVMGHLAGVLTFSEDQDRRNALFDEAQAMAKRLGDERALARILAVKLTARWGVPNLEATRANVEVLMRCAHTLGDERMRGFARLFEGLLACETGALDAALVAMADGERLLSRTGEPWFRFAVGFARAAATIAAGDPVKAETEIQRTFEIGGGDNELAFPIFISQRILVLWQQGRFVEMETFGRQIFSVTSFTEYVDRLYRLVFVTVSAELGRMGEARAIWERYAPREFSSIHSDTLQLGFLAHAARGVELFGDVERAVPVYDLLLPHADRAVVIGGCMIYGATAKYLGLAAKTLSRFDDAVRHFEQALHVERQMPFWLAESRLLFARTLLLRNSPGDRARALALLGEAVEGARACGAKVVLERALALKLELEGIADESPRSSIDRVAISIEVTRPDLSPAAAPDGTVTLLFTDMESFSAMTERLGDRRAHEVMREHHRVVRAEVAKHGGFEVDEQGDGFLLAFSSARRGVQCAVAIQSAFEAVPLGGNEAIRVRMGLHTGEVIREGKTFFGKTVILAARIAASARGGEILVSGVVRDLVGSEDGIAFGRIREVELAGLSGKQRVCAVGWDGKEPADADDQTAARRDPAATANVFRRDGDYWTIEYDGKELSLKDTKGVKYIARLLAENGRELHALELVGGDAEGAADTGGVGEALDSQARADYRRRAAELESEIAEARAANDLGRVERLQHEIDFLARELSAAFGLGGRARKTGEAAERARKAVYSRVVDAIARIRKDHGALAMHFENAIQLGTFCAYRPERPTRWEL